MKLLVLGTRSLGYHGLKRLLEEQFNVVAVATYDYPITEGFDSAAFRRLCDHYGVPIRVTEQVNAPDFVQWVRDTGADLGLSLYWKRLIGKELIDALPMGFLNLHASDLPRYRGFACHTWAILRGESHYGITLHYMKPSEADSGDIAVQRLLPLGPRTRISDVLSEITSVGVDMVIEYLRLLETGRATPRPMRLAEGFFSYPRLTRDGEIDWSQKAETIDRLIRAVTRPYPGAFTYHDGKKLVIWEAEPVVPSPPFVGVPGHVVGYQKNGRKGALVTTGEGLLLLTEVQYEGEPTSFNPADRWRSVQIRFGPCLTDELVFLRTKVAELEERLRSLETRYHPL
jgi:methionyl-tRNA formyltransferase